MSALLRTYNQIHSFIFWTRMDTNLTQQQKPSSHQQRKLIAFVISHRRRFHDYSRDEKYPAGVWGRVFKGWSDWRLTWSEMTLWFHNIQGQQHIWDMRPSLLPLFHVFVCLSVLSLVPLFFWSHFRSLLLCPLSKIKSPNPNCYHVGFGNLQKWDN